jgi:hypothetical protein
VPPTEVLVSKAPGEVPPAAAGTIPCSTAADKTGVSGSCWVLGDGGVGAACCPLVLMGRWCAMVQSRASAPTAVMARFRKAHRAATRL